MVWGCGKGSKFRFHIISMFCQVQDYSSLFVSFSGVGGGVMGKSSRFELSMFCQTPGIQGSQLLYSLLQHNLWCPDHIEQTMQIVN